MSNTNTTHRTASAMLAFLSILPASAFAQDAPAGGTEFTCEVTAYYSALPDQERYYTGNYEDELVLQGNGTNGADGTPVYVGMIAAPKSVPFGTKIYIPGFGLGTVHDRGGAIIEKKNAIRIDVWMGHGDLGLSRALNWGRRTKSCTMFAKGSAIPGDVASKAGTLSDLPARESTGAAPIAKQFYDRDLTIGDVHDKVLALEKDLAKFGSFKGTPNTTFDAVTAAAVFAFQKDQKIVSNPDGYGAGYFGYQTRRALSRWRNGDTAAKEPESAKAVPAAKESLATMKGKLAKGDSGPLVVELQRALMLTGDYPNLPSTGVFGNHTRAGVLAFQLRTGLMASPESAGAGTVGAVTGTALLKAAGGKHAETKVYGKGSRSEVIREGQELLRVLGLLEKEDVTGYLGDRTSEALYTFQKTKGLVHEKTDDGAGQLGPRTLAALRNAVSEKAREAETLREGDRGDAVRELQTNLRAAGFLDTPASGYFGPSTRAAVLAFQQHMKLVASASDKGAGMFGPLTKKTFLSFLHDRTKTAPPVPVAAIVKTETLATATVPGVLKVGDRGDEVRILQEKLRAEGLLAAPATGFYGEATRDAVLALQRRLGIVASATDTGAGMYGPVTKKAWSA